MVVHTQVTPLSIESDRVFPESSSSSPRHAMPGRWPPSYAPGDSFSCLSGVFIHQCHRNRQLRTHSIKCQLCVLGNIPCGGCNCQYARSSRVDSPIFGELLIRGRRCTWCSSNHCNQCARWKISKNHGHKISNGRRHCLHSGGTSRYG